MRIRRESGITIVEVMVVIAVMAITLAFAVPAIHSWLPDFRLMKASRDLYSNFQMAKIAAVKSNCNCTVTFNQVVEGVTYGYVIFVDEATPSNSSYDPGERIIARVRWQNYKGVSPDSLSGFSTNGDGLTSVSFNSRGLALGLSSDLATVSLVNTNSRKRDVEVMVTGNIRVHAS